MSPFTSTADTVPTESPAVAAALTSNAYESASNRGGWGVHVSVVAVAVEDQNPTRALYVVPSPYAPTLNSCVLLHVRRDAVWVVPVTLSSTVSHVSSPLSRCCTW